MRKKLFAVIMSAMMMITFMPTMAFAGVDATSLSWNDGYTKVSYSVTDNTGTYNTSSVARSQAMKDASTPADASNPFGGMIKATPVNDEVSSNGVVYYDFSCAKITKIGNLVIPSTGRITQASAEAVFGASYDKEVSANAILFSVPTYVINKDETWNGVKKVADMTKELTYNELETAGFVFTVDAPAFDFEKMYTEDQTFALKVNPDISSNANNIGVPSATIIIAKEKASKDNAKYLLDGKTELTLNTEKVIKYDGAEHKLAQKEVSGVTSTYKLYNKSTGKYENVSGDAVVFKNVGKYYVKATAKDKDGTKEYSEFKVKVEPSCKAAITFKGTQDSNGDFNFKVAGKFDPKDYLKVYQYDYATATAEAKKAVKADEKLITAFCNEWYEITVDEDSVAKIGAKDLTDAEKATIKKKYAELIANYKDMFAAEGTANFKVIDDITFTKAPLTKTFKAKKGKLPKAKKFTVKAKAASGATLVYKIKNGAGKITVNRTTGKVTVKKGLKKGTYKVKVCAITLKSFDTENPIQDSYTLKIKVK